MKTETVMKILVTMLITFFLMGSFISNAQTLKLNAHVLTDDGLKCKVGIQVKEFTESGAALIREFKVKDGKIIIPLNLGKKYVIHFFSSGKQFKSIVVDCTGNHLSKDYSFEFEITLFDETPTAKPCKELVAKVWLDHEIVQFTKL